MTHPDTLQIPRAVVEQLHARLLSGELYDDYDGDMALVGALRAALQPQAADHIVDANKMAAGVSVEPVASDNPDFMTIPVEYQYAYPDGTWRFSNGDAINGMKPTAARPRTVRKKGLSIMDILKRIDFVQQFANECGDGAWSIDTAQWKHHVTPELIEDIRQYIVSLQLKLMHEQTAQANPFTYLWEADGTCEAVKGHVTISQNTGPAYGWKITPLYTATAIAAARVQENERCLAMMDAIGCDWRDAGDMAKFYATNYLREAIRALLGKESTCTSDEWLANCPQSVRDLADKIKGEKA